jgi:aminoglycoside phosphotransferase (APT) family kinase protein
VVFGATVGMLAAFLVAPQRTEFGTKVAVLGALVVVCAVAPFLERFGPRLDATTTALVERLAPLAASYPERAWVGPLVVAHGDYRLDNLLFRGGRATIIDWQSLRLGPPGLDLGILIGAALDTDTRRAHQDALITRWHDAIVASGVSGFTRDDAAASVRAGCLWTFLLTVGLATTLAQSERGDAMWAGMVARSAELVSDLGADAVLI